MTLLALLLLGPVYITEVYVHGNERKKGRQWLEIVNVSEKPVNLNAATLRRLDGKDQKEAWRVALPFNDLHLAPRQYAIIAQRGDLGRMLCSDITVLEVKEKQFAFKASGTQSVCIMPDGEAESCSLLSDSKKIEKDHSRNLIPGSWITETCELSPGFFASPGLPLGFCENNIASPWRECSLEAETVSLQTGMKKRQLATGCASTQVSNLTLILLALLWIIFRKGCALYKHDIGALARYASRFPKSKVL
ncbi:MAG: hypothetical protein V4534_08885 [Myxococcota bacterium]